MAYRERFVLSVRCTECGDKHNFRKEEGGFTCATCIVDAPEGATVVKTILVPIEYEVCPQCNGHGKHVHQALSVWSEEDRAQDPDSFENMMAGMYDVVCTLCKGQRVVDASPEACEARAEAEQDRKVRLQESGIHPGHPDYF